MATVTAFDAKTRFGELLERVSKGEEVVITRDGKEVAKLVPELPWGVPIAGRAKGMLIIHAEDDEHLKDFAEYMP